MRCSQWTKTTQERSTGCLSVSEESNALPHAPSRGRRLYYIVIALEKDDGGGGDGDDEHIAVSIHVAMMI
jgi:hypothetical protein